MAANYGILYMLFAIAVGIQWLFDIAATIIELVVDSKAVDDQYQSYYTIIDSSEYEYAIIAMIFSALLLMIPGIFIFSIFRCCSVVSKGWQGHKGQLITFVIALVLFVSQIGLVIIQALLLSLQSDSNCDLYTNKIVDSINLVHNPDTIAVRMLFDIPSDASDEMSISLASEWMKSHCDDRYSLRSISLGLISAPTCMSLITIIVYVKSIVSFRSDD